MPALERDLLAVNFEDDIVRGGAERLQRNGVGFRLRRFGRLVLSDRQRTYAVRSRAARAIRIAPNGSTRAMTRSAMRSSPSSP